MRFGLQENIGDIPGLTIKAVPISDDPLSLIASLTDRGPTDREWLAAVARLRTLLNSELGRFFAGTLSADQFGDAVFRQLIEGHAVSVAAGRMRAGVHGQLSTLDRQVALFHGEQQGPFLEGFVRRLNEKVPRYWDEEAGEWRRGMINRDLQMYASRYRGSANIAFEANSPDDAQFYWRLGPAEHCPDCLELAADSPYAKFELSVFPGDGGTVCLVNCKCWLQRADGVKGFPPDKGVGKWIPDQTPTSGLIGDDSEAADRAVAEAFEDSRLLPGSPVSYAVQVRKGKVEADIRTALAVIDEVHSDGLLPPIVSGALREKGEDQRVEGWYLPASETQLKYHKSISLISLNPTAEEPLLTVAHEVGHALEIELFGPGAIVFKSAPIHWHPVADAILETRAIAQLLVMRAQARDIVDHALATGDKAIMAMWGPALKYLEYLLYPAEIWARAYAQFIYARSNKRAVKSEMVRIRASDERAGFPSQWENDDFAPIYQAILAAMVKEGWIEKA